MRIIAGKNKGKHIVAPANLPVRPTTDLGKESLFNILNNYFFFDAVTVIDLFAGTGNISLEFASRGATSVTAVDLYPDCVNFIKKMGEQLQYLNLTTVRADAFQFLEKLRQPVNIIFADPPYDLEGIERLPEIVFRRNLLLPDGWLILEHSKVHDFSSHPNFYQHRKYGKLNFTFLVNMTE
ncbi:MAG: RsmD family RNA methyltransferase [Bacteroidales bacterium]|jgi:16S rRNA (guanine(966)-N(2))-methyltransferase RsmD|nr:RsmD family RNA methyltransferase [Bacteroidales bacterium]MCR5114806.1 RsmD family RNA methyltransferase [Bacteroidales bacterium]